MHNLILIITKHVAAVLARVSPVVGLVVIFSSVESHEGGPWTEIWRIALSIALGVFVALVGAIYQNINRRVESFELAAKTDFVPRKEYESRHQDLMSRFDRIEDLITGRKK